MYDREHLFLQWTAYFRAGNGPTGDLIETVVGGLRFGSGTLQASDNDETLDRLVTVLSNYWSTPASRIPSNCYLEVVKWNRLGVDGRYASNSETRQREIVPVPGTAVMRYPTQIAWATTWTTDFRRGRAHAGRTYWPTAEPLAQNLSQWPAAGCAAKAENDYGLIRDLNAAARPTPESNTSAMVMSNIGQGVSRLITGCKVGSRPDVQRRRARSIAEGYQSFPVIPD